MKNWNPKNLARRVTLIGDTTPQVVDLSLFSGLRQRSFITTDFTVLPYDLGKPIEVADVFVQIRETQMPLMLGYEYRLPDGRIVYSYDHHGPDIRMQRQISSTSLAQELMRRTQNPFRHVFGTHVDADSVLAWFVLLTGNLDMRLGEAAIAADHTGATNRIADVLQSLTELRNVEFSFDCLKALLYNEPLPDKAQKLLEVRLHDRERAFQYVRDGVIEHVGNGVYVGRFEEMLPGELLPALIPDAKIIVLVSSLQEAGVKEIKVRSGREFPEGMSLNQLRLPGYGGRWNAGGTKRHGGTLEEEVDDFIAILINAMAVV